MQEAHLSFQASLSWLSCDLGLLNHQVHYLADWVFPATDWLPLRPEPAVEDLGLWTSAVWRWTTGLGQSRVEGGSGSVLSWMVGGLGRLKLAAAVCWTFCCVCGTGVKVQRHVERSFHDHSCFSHRFYDTNLIAASRVVRRSHTAEEETKKVEGLNESIHQRGSSLYVRGRRAPR